MKNLKPSHRENKRYLLIKGRDADKKAIEETILEFIGILGYAKAGVGFVKTESSGVVLAVNRKSLNEIRASFVASNKDIQITRVSGSLKGLKK